MKHILKKSIAGVLTMAMVLALAPTMAFADETLQSQIDTANTTKTTITLTKDYTEDITIPKDADITLDLDEYTLTGTLINNGTLEIKGTDNEGEIAAGATDWAIKNDGDLTIEDGVTVSTENDEASLIRNGTDGAENDPTLTIEGGTFTGGLNNLVTDPGSVTYIKGGTFSGSSGENGTAALLIYGDAEITSGNVTSSSAAVSVVGDESDVVISGGYFNGVVNNTGITDSYTLSISGGTFTKSISQGYIATNYYIESGDGVYEVKEVVVDTNVATNTSTGETYTTFAAALDEATSGDTVTLLCDAELFADYDLEKNLTIKMEGFTVSGAEFEVSNSVTVSISNGKFIHDDGNAIYAFGGNINLDNVSAEAYYRALYLNGASTVNVTDGTFSREATSTTHGAISVTSNTSTLTLNGNISTEELYISKALAVNIAESATVVVDDFVTINSGYTLTNDGNITAGGTITNKGTIVGGITGTETATLINTGSYSEDRVTYYEADTYYWVDNAWTTVAEQAESFLEDNTSEDIANDSALLEELNELDAALIEANANLDVDATLDTTGIDTADQIDSVSAPEGLAAAYYSQISTNIENGDVVDLTLGVAQIADTTADFAFSAKPYVSIGGGEKSEILNTDLDAPITFKVYLPSSFDSDYAKVEHVKESGQSEYLYLPVLEDEGGRYIQITVTEFSNFYVSSYTPSSSSSKSYYIKATATGNGTVAPEDEDVSPDSMYKVSKLSDVTFEFDADSGYEVADVIVNGSSVGACDEYEFEDIIITMQTLEVVFEKSSSSSSSSGGSSSSSDDDDEDEDVDDEEVEDEDVVEIELPFADIDEDNDNLDGIAFVYDNGIMAGISEDVFGSDLSITRGMIAAILYRVDGSEPVDADMLFADVAADQYYLEAVKWGKAEGVMAGVSETEFAPNTAIAQEQFVAFLYRYASVLGMDMTVEYSEDMSEFVMSDYAITAVAWALENDIIDDDDFDAMAEALRGDVATALMNFIEMM